MGLQTVSDTCPIIEVALANADEIFIEGLPSFRNGLMFVFFLSEYNHLSQVRRFYQDFSRQVNLYVTENKILRKMCLRC